LLPLRNEKRPAAPTGGNEFAGIPTGNPLEERPSGRAGGRARGRGGGRGRAGARGRAPGDQGRGRAGRALPGAVPIAGPPEDVGGDGALDDPGAHEEVVEVLAADPEAFHEIVHGLEIGEGDSECAVEDDGQAGAAEGDDAGDGGDGGASEGEDESDEGPSDPVVPAVDADPPPPPVPEPAHDPLLDCVWRAPLDGGYIMRSGVLIGRLAALGGRTKISCRMHGCSGFASNRVAFEECARWVARGVPYPDHATLAQRQDAKNAHMRHPYPRAPDP
jgi:hypothetical protein